MKARLALRSRYVMVLSFALAMGAAVPVLTAGTSPGEPAGAPTEPAAAPPPSATALPATEAGSGQPADLAAEPVVRLETELGIIDLALAAEAAPLSVANFLRYVDAGLYDGARFHRTVRTVPDNQPQNAVKIDVIQGGVAPDREAQSFPPITLERTRDSRLAHRDGTVSMARAAPDTATGDFFVCLGDQPELDFAGRRNPDGQGFAAFGRVVRGMAVVQAIHRAPAEGQALAPPIRILSARRLGPADAANPAAMRADR